MDIFEAGKEMEKGKMLLGSDDLKYKIVSNRLFYFDTFKKEWINDTLCFVDLINLTFEEIKEPIKTLSNKIVDAGIAYETYVEHCQVIKVKYVKEFIKQITNKKGFDLKGYGLAYYDEFVERIKEFAGPRFK